MTAAQIDCFITTAKNMSFSKAANEIFLSQSAVSRHVITLEKELGTQLFVRAGKYIYLTDAGKAFYEFFLRTKNEFVELKRCHTPEEGARQTLSYAVLPVWNITELLEENAQKAMQNHPGWELTMKFCGVTKIISDLRSGAVDVILHTESALNDMRGVTCRPLGTVRCILLFSDRHPLAANPSLTPNDFENEEFLYVADEGMPLERVSSVHDRFEERYGFRPRLVGVEDTEALAMMLESGHGVVLLNYWSRPKQQKNMRYISLDIGERVALACMKNSKSPIVGPFMEESVKFLAEHM